MVNKPLTSLNWGMDDLGPCVFRLCSWARGAKESVTGLLTTENESQGIHGTAGIFTYRKTIKKKINNMLVKYTIHGSYRGFELRNPF